MTDRLFFCFHDESNSALVGRVDSSGATVLFPKSFPADRKDVALHALLFVHACNPPGVFNRPGYGGGCYDLVWIALEDMSGSPYFQDVATVGRVLGCQVEKEIRDFWRRWDRGASVVRRGSGDGAEPHRG